MLKRYAITIAEVPPGWQLACDNYMHSDLGKFSLADLCQPGRYPVFVKSKVNIFNKPKEETIDEQLARLRREDGEEPGGGLR
jgi:hypothetical protein